jgi:hypothetical protein
VATALDPQGRLGPEGRKGAGEQCIGEEWEVETIVGERGSGEDTEYRVRWAGWDRDADSWEPADHIRGCEGLVAQWRSRRAASEETAGSWPATVIAARAEVGEGTGRYAVLHGFWPTTVRHMLMDCKEKNAHKVLRKVSGAIAGDPGYTGQADMMQVYHGKVRAKEEEARKARELQEAGRQQRGVQDLANAEGAEVSERLAARAAARQQTKGRYGHKRNGGRAGGERDRQKDNQTRGWGDGAQAKARRASRLRQTSLYRFIRNTGAPPEGGAGSTPREPPETGSGDMGEGQRAGTQGGDDDEGRHLGPRTEYAQRKRQKVGHTGPNLFKYFFVMSLMFLVGVRGEEHSGSMTRSGTVPNTHSDPNNSNKPLGKCSTGNALAAPLLTRDRFGDG